MGDTCNGERKAKRLVASAAEAAKRLEIGDEAWEAMSEDARTTSCKAYTSAIVTTTCATS